MEVYFDQMREADSFCLFLREKCPTWRTIRKRGNIQTVHIVTDEEIVMESCKQQIAQLLAMVYVRHREIQAIESILQKVYHFSNETEMERITSLAISLIEKDADIYEHRIHQHELHDILQAIFFVNMEKDIIRYDSIIHFRFHHYFEQLTQLVGLAIDEFKREEEYQEYVHSLREFVKRKNPELDVIYVLEGSTFEFYKEDGTCMEMSELREYVNQFPLYLLGLPEDEWDISPLISMSPNHIYLFCYDTNEPRIQTLMSIFQEKCSFYSLEKFPFYIEKEKGS